MTKFISPEEQLRIQKFNVLLMDIRKQQSEKLQRRLKENPHPSITENALGAFLEMYEPHLISIVLSFLEKGILLEPLSGFDNAKPDQQILYGNFFFDDKISKKLTNLGVSIIKSTKKKMLKFIPVEDSLESILSMYKDIADVFPQHSGDIQISQTTEAKKFRRTYIPHDSQLKNTRLLDILMHEIHESVSLESKQRMSQNPKPSQMETNLGVFTEMIEPQVREAVLELQRKGYSTDISGFMGDSGTQQIAGDFSIPDHVRKQIEKLDVSVETNNSGYTVISFQVLDADRKKIYDKWMNIVALFPDHKQNPSPSMTSKARDFRKKYQNR